MTTQRFQWPARSILALAVIGMGFSSVADAAPITFAAAGSSTAAIQATVDAYRVAISLGGANNGNTLGSQPTGRREINWDGGGTAANATLFPSPMNTFNSGATTRGLVSTSPGGVLEISGQPAPEFGDINPTYPDIFQPFSAPRIFSPIGSNITDVLFFVPGTATPATVLGFGAVFLDVDLTDTSSLQFFSPNGALLGTAFAPTTNNGLSFLGLLFTEPIFRVRITTGNSALGPNDGAFDVVALDDFIFAEPQAAVPEPSTLLLLGVGAIAAGRFRRRRR